MIASSDDPGADAGGEKEGNMFTECCNMVEGEEGEEEEEDCVSWNRLAFPRRNCDFLGIAFGEFIYKLVVW